MPRPYTDLSNPPRLGCLVGVRCVFLRGVVGIIVTGRGIVPLELFTNRARHASPLHRFIEPTAPWNASSASCCVSLRGVVGIIVTGRGIVPLELFTNRAEACLAPTQIYRTRPWNASSAPVAFFCRDVGIIVTGRGIVPLELFTNRARHASPLHRFIEPTAPGMPRRRPLRFSAGRRRHHRDGSRNCSVGAVYKPGEACLAPTQIYRTHRAWDASSAPVAFSAGRRRHHRDGVEELFRWSCFTNRARHASPLHRFIEPTAPWNASSASCCVSLRRVVGIIVTGRGIVPLELFTNRGRGMPRPYTDLSNPPPHETPVGHMRIGPIRASAVSRTFLTLVLHFSPYGLGRRERSRVRTVDLNGACLVFATLRLLPRHHRDGSRNCSVGAVYKPGEACLAPTQIYRTPPRLGCLVGRPLRFSAGRRRHHRDGSRNCSVGAVYKPGEACLAPTQIYRTHSSTWDAHVGARCVFLRDVVGIIVHGPRNCSVGAVYKPGEACLAPTQIYRNATAILGCSLVGDPLRFSCRGVVGIIVTGRGIVPLELFTNRARHASPLHRFIEPTAPGMPRRRPLRFSAGRRRP